MADEYEVESLELEKEKKPKGLSKEALHAKFTDVMARVAKIKSDQSSLKTMFRELSNMYWIDDSVNLNASAWDENDVRYTKSPNARNDITGVHNMFKTSFPSFKVTCKNKDYANKMEAALKKWWQISCERKIASIHDELVLSAAMFSDGDISVVILDDLLNLENSSPVRTKRLQDRRKQTPFFFEAESPMVTYPVWGDDGLSEWLQVYKMQGKQLKERWGNLPNVKDDVEYTINDYWDWEVRCVYLDEDTQDYILCGEHGLIDMPRFSAIAGGTEMFDAVALANGGISNQTAGGLPVQGGDHKRQPFLYGVWKSGLHKRADEALTTLFTSNYSRGSGPLILIDPSTPNFDENNIKVNYKGIVRYIVAKGQPTDDKAFDSNIINLLQMLDQMAQRSTINSQTLGENIDSGTPYSGYAMASQNGRVQVLAIQVAVQKVIHDACMFALRQFKASNMQWEGLKATEIPDDFELTVELKVDLPQDSFRNAQTAATLDDKVSVEWTHNLLGIDDSEAMMFDIMSEQALKAAFQAGLPSLIQEMMAMFAKRPPPPPPPPPPNNPTTNQTPPNSMPPLDQVTMPGGPAGAMAGGQVTPALEPLPPSGGGVA